MTPELELTYTFIGALAGVYLIIGTIVTLWQLRRK